MQTKVLITRSEWLTCSDPRTMLLTIRESKPSERKVRLFNAAVCRRFWTYLPAESQAILLESERLADGLIRAPEDEMKLCTRANAVVVPFDRQYPSKQFPNREIHIQRNAAAAVCYAVIPNELFGAYSYFQEIDPMERVPQSSLVRDIFGNPFQAVATIRDCLIPSVVGLAQAIYDENAFDRLPELADALIDAGCNNADIVSHCRSEGPHIRGCWVVDWVLGKV